MAHQSGITACSDLCRAFDVGQSGRLRLIKVVIQAEQLVPETTAVAAGSWEQDYNHLVVPCLSEDQPCYIFYRLDSRQPHTGSYDWIFISYTPDRAPVRQKMLYAATTVTLKNEFGPHLIKDELFGTSPDDVTLEGFRQHLSSQSAPKPLTDAERQLEGIRKDEAEARLQGGRRTLKAAAFPLSQDAIQTLHGLKAGNINYVQLSLNIRAETIELESAGVVDIEKLSNVIPLEESRYHFYTFQYVRGGARLKSTVFIYSMPANNSPPIKERMLYSTCKGPLIEFAEQQIGLTVARRIETDDAREITGNFLFEQLHSKPTAFPGGAPAAAMKAPDSFQPPW